MSSDGFRPAWWLPGAHAQTLGARLLRSPRGVRFRRERVELPDGDFLDLDWAECDGEQSGSHSSDRPLVVVLHGLEGWARSKYALETYRALNRHGLAAVGLNFRTCSGEPNRLARMYHSGETGDLSYVLELLRTRDPNRLLGAVGFSLGGNVLLKYLGEMGQAAERGGERQRVVGVPIGVAVAISVPFDLAAGAERIEQGFARVYRSYLVRRLKRKVRAKASVLRPHVDVERLLRTRTFREFDDVGTAPLHGFADADDYYRRSSSAQYLPAIRVSTLLIQSTDDPFLPGSAIPYAPVRGNPHLTGSFSDRGGHVGFVSGSLWAPVFWAEGEAARFIAARLKAVRES